METEKDITKAILHYLKGLGAFAFKHWSGPLSRKGISDIIGVLQGRAVFIEVKRPGGRASEEQQAFIEDVTRAGGLGMIADSLDQVKSELEGQGFESIQKGLF